MVLETICKVIAQHMDTDVEKVTAESTLEELGIDSLDMVEITMTLEEELDISLEGISGIQTVGDVANYVAAQKG